MKDFKNKVAVITGAGNGVERQIIALTNCITRSKYSYKIKIT